MREFMTKMSDYLNERRNNPEKQEDRLAAVIIGAVAVVVIVLLLLVLWGHIAKGRSREDDEPVSATYEEHAAEYMSQGVGEGELTQKYLDNIAYLNGTVEKLLASLTQIEENLTETVEQYQEGDTVIREEISSLHTEVNTIMRSLKETQTKLQDLVDIVMVMNEETIPVIQAQIAELYENMNQIYTDIANLYTKLTGNVLQYRYNEKENTLYLEPYQEGSGTASASGSSPTGSLSAYGGRVVFSNKDVTYLDNELGLLLNEIDNSILGSASADVVFDSADKRRNLLTSHGIINYDNGKVVANAAGLLALADKTDTLANAYAAASCRALNSIGTYFNTDGDINHESQAAGSIALNCARIVAGILQSQSVEHLKAAPVTADNITAGAAAWVNGKCIIGNGADNARAYQHGIEDGAAGNGENVDIQRTYHVHRNGDGEEVTEETVYDTNDPGGCYRANGHTHDATGACPVDYKQCSGQGAEIQHHSSCKDSGSEWGTDNGHIHCGAYCQVCGSMVSGPYAKCTNITTSYICNDPTNTWKIGCGKNKGEIESETIIIRKNNRKGE